MIEKVLGGSVLRDAKYIFLAAFNLLIVFWVVGGRVMYPVLQT